VTEDERAILAELHRREELRAREAYCPHEPTSKQRAFLEYDDLEALYGGAAGGGKSDALLMAALKYVHVPGYSALLLRRTFADLALPGAIMDRARTWLAGTDARWNGQDKRFTFPSGASITFGYLESRDDHLRYQGTELQFVGFDELTQFEERQYRYLFSRLRRLSGTGVPLRMRGATNPGGPGHVWVKGRYDIPDTVDMSKPHVLEKRVFFPSKLEDNPHVDRQQYEESLAELDTVTRSQLRDGSWAMDKSSRIYEFQAGRHLIDRLPPLPRKREWRYVLGIDYGNVDATALAVWAFCVELGDVCYLVESQKWDNLIPDTAAKIVTEWSKRYPFSRIVGDVGGLGKGYAEEGRQRFALPIEPAQKQNKLGYIKLINGAYQSDKIKVVKATNADFIAEATDLPWKNELRLEEMPGIANHLCDAHLYGWRECKAFFHQAEDETKPKRGTPEWQEQQEDAAAEEEARAAREEDAMDRML